MASYRVCDDRPQKAKRPNVRAGLGDRHDEVVNRAARETVSSASRRLSPRRNGGNNLSALSLWVRLVCGVKVGVSTNVSVREV
jgi:hypothetical protein